MMNMLLGFLKYFNQNIKDIALESFLNELFTQLYEKESQNMNKFIQNGNHVEQSKTYCKVHKQCNEQLSKDLIQIKDSFQLHPKKK